MPLVLSRKPTESIVLRDKETDEIIAVVTVGSLSGGRAKLAITADQSIRITRSVDFKGVQ